MDKEESKVKTKQYSLAKNELNFLQTRANIQSQYNLIIKDLEFVMKTYISANICQRLAMKREEYTDFEIDLDKGTVTFILPLPPQQEKKKDEK